MDSKIEVWRCEGTAFAKTLPRAYFRSAGSRAELERGLQAVLADLAAGRTAEAKARLEDARAALGSLIAAETTLALVSDELVRLERSILQQEANRPPIARACTARARTRGPSRASCEVRVWDDALSAFAPVQSFDPYPANTHGSTLASAYVGF